MKTAWQALAEVDLVLAQLQDDEMQVREILGNMTKKEREDFAILLLALTRNLGMVTRADKKVMG